MTRTPIQLAQDAVRAKKYRERAAQKRKAIKAEQEYMQRTEYKRNKENLKRNEELCNEIYNLEEKEDE